MTFRSASRRFALPVMTGLLAVAIGGCASRRLDAPPVVDWSGARPPAGAIAGTVVSPTAPSPEAPVAESRPIGNEPVEQRPLGTPLETAPAPVVPQPSNAPLKTGPLGVKRPYSDVALAELQKPDSGAPAAAAAAPAATPAEPVNPMGTAPGALPSAGRLTWAWPAGGRVLSTFDGKSKGIDIAGKAGDPVVAAADGKVTFAGVGVRGYGNFVIVRHSPELLSVYAHNRSNLVKEGAVVTRGQKIAEMGNSDTDAVKLHFEIRNDSKPVDPTKYLPER